jgi:hypothetical protein
LAGFASERPAKASGARPQVPLALLGASGDLEARWASLRTLSNAPSGEVPCRRAAERRDLSKDRQRQIENK